MSSEPEDESSVLEAYRHGRCAFFPDSLGLHVDAHRNDVPFNKPELRGGVRTFPLYGRFAHEEDHLLRTVGTSWGLMCHILQGRGLHQYLGLLGEVDLRSQSEVLWEDFRRIRRLDPTAPELAAEGNPARRAYGLHLELDLRRVLLGVLPFGSMAGIATTLARHWGLTDCPTASGQLFPRPPNAAFPQEPISALSIMESLGILKESVYAVTYEEARDGEVVSKADTAYSFALSYARSVLAEQFNWETQPVELEAALNLALWPPLIPSGIVPGSVRHWNDVDAGYRYCRVIEWLRERGERLTHHDDCSESDRDALFRNFFGEACAHFDWPTPTELAAAWLEHLDEATPWSRTRYQWWCLGERRLRTSYAKRLLKDSSDHPYGAWFPAVTEATGSRPTFSYTAYDDLVEIPENHRDTDGKTISGRLESYIFLGMRYVLQGRAGSKAEKEILNEHLRLIPQLIDPGVERDQAHANCDYLRERLEASLPERSKKDLSPGIRDLHAP